MMRYNPHKRLKEINDELCLLEKEERRFMMKKYKSKPKRYIDVERIIFFLVMEKMQIEKVINFFRYDFEKIAKKYPKHYWRWQFFGKSLFPDLKSENKNKTKEEWLDNEVKKAKEEKIKLQHRKQDDKYFKGLQNERL